MPNTINLRLLDNKNIIAEMQGIPLANENSYKIIAGESNATNFKIASKPLQYKDARYTVEMVNSQGCGIEEKDVENDTFILPEGMAVAGYGVIKIKAYLGEEEVPFMPLKIKVWNTLPNWNKGVSKDTKVVQGLGDSYVDVMSQQAVTREIKRLSILSPEGFDKINKRVDTLYQLLEYGKVGKVAEDVPNNSPFRQTGVYFDSDIGENIALDVMDKSPTTVTKIQGKGTISGIKSIGKNAINTDNLVGNALVNNNDGTYTLTRGSGRFSKEAEILYLSGLIYYSAEIVSIYDPTANNGNGGYVDSGAWGISIRLFDNEGVQIISGGVPAKLGFSPDSVKGVARTATSCDIYINGSAPIGYAITFKNLMFMPDDSKTYYPYAESIMTLPTLLTLKEFDVWENGKRYDYTGKVEIPQEGYAGITPSSDDPNKFETFDISTSFPFGIDESVEPTKVTIENILADTNYTVEFSLGFNGMLEAQVSPAITENDFNNGLLMGDIVANKSILYKTLTPISITDFIFNNEYKAYNGGTEQMLGLVDNLVPTVYNEYLISIGKEEGDDE